MKWGKQTQQEESSEQKTSIGSAQKEITIIASGTFLSGDVEVRTDLLVKGEIKAGVLVEGCLTVGAQGKIESKSILCCDADISGRIEGDITVADTLSIRPGGIIDGNISAGNIIIEQGGRFCGQSRYLSEKECEQLRSRLSGNTTATTATTQQTNSATHVAPTTSETPIATPIATPIVPPAEIPIKESGKRKSTSLNFTPSEEVAQ